jgi:hypothetical protein
LISWLTAALDRGAGPAAALAGALVAAVPGVEAPAEGDPVEEADGVADAEAGEIMGASAPVSVVAVLPRWSTTSEVIR